ncbi:MAG: MAPEG family protein [Candidatus Neomarinimicrobiota bacterium]
MFFLIFRLLYMAAKYAQNKKVKLSQFRIYEGECPDRLRSARQQFQNMFEIPILFYLLCLLNIFFNNYNQLDIILCWCFVVFRGLHFFLRIQNQKTINIIPRTLVFIISLIFLTTEWISLLINSFVI